MENINKADGEETKVEKEIELIEVEKKDSGKTGSRNKKKSANKQYSGKGKRIRKRIKWIIILIILVVAGLVYFKMSNQKKQMEAVMQKNRATQTAKVERRDITTAITSTGTVEAETSRTLASTAKNTTISEVNAEVGDYVTAGEVMVTFDQEKVLKQIEQVKEDIADSKQKDAISAKSKERKYMYTYTSEANNLSSASEKVETALQNLYEACDAYGNAKRAKEDDPDFEKKSEESYDSEIAKAYENEIKAQQDYDAAVEALANANRSSENTLSQAEEDYETSTITEGNSTEELQRKLEEYEDSLADYVLIAPIDGIVTSVLVEEGNGFSGGNVMTIQNTESYKITTQIDEYDIPDIELGQRVIIKTDATRDDELEGVVSFISPTATTGQSSGVSYAVEIDLLSNDSRIRIGMSAKLNIIVDMVENVLTVPYDAISEDEMKNSVVYVVDNNTPGERSNNNTNKSIKEQKAEREREKENDSIIGKIKSLFSNDKAEPKMESMEMKTRAVKVTVGAEGDYYTQIDSDEIKEGTTVVIQDSEEAANPFADMMGGPGGGGMGGALGGGGGGPR